MEGGLLDQQRHHRLHLPEQDGDEQHRGHPRPRRRLDGKQSDRDRVALNDDRSEQDHIHRQQTREDPLERLEHVSQGKVGRQRRAGS